MEFNRRKIQTPNSIDTQSISIHPDRIQKIYTNYPFMVNGKLKKTLTIF